jgi:uroporphyrinogen III methyltransferase/synthase
VVDVIGEKGIRPPSLFVVGKVVDHAPDLSWFQERPLFGSTVLVAGSKQTSTKLRGRLSVLGAEVLTQAAIRISEPVDWAPVDAALDQIHQYDWVVFSSGSGVDGLMGRILASGKDARALGGVRLAALGTGTAERLRHYHLNPDLVPEKVDAAALADSLMNQAPGGAFLLARATGDRPVLAEELEEIGAGVDQVPVYRTVDVDEPDQDVADALKAGEVHWLTVTSSPTARAMVRLYGDLLKSTKIVSISPLTSATLRELGHDPAIEATPHTVDGLLDSILSAGD